MARVYGNLINRLQENRNHLKDGIIKEGDDITLYMWSDRTCYYVDKVIDQKHIIVKPYHVCADHSKPGGQGHQDWLYFKTLKEQNKYLNDQHIMYNGKEQHWEENPVESKGEEWVFRYGKWYKVIGKSNEGNGKPTYTKVGNISFGVRDYYYDWEF